MKAPIGTPLHQPPTHGATSSGKRADASAQKEWYATGTVSDHLFRLVYKFAYRGHLMLNFLTRPASKGAYVAVWHNDHILLIRNSYKATFTLPCGGIEAGESTLDAARRELSEEVGLNLPRETFMHAYETHNRTEFKDDHITLYEVALSHQPDAKPDGREVVWAGYRDPVDALNMPLFPPVRDYLLQRTARTN